MFPIAYMKKNMHFLPLTFICSQVGCSAFLLHPGTLFTLYQEIQACRHVTFFVCGGRGACSRECEGVVIPTALSIYFVFFFFFSLKLGFLLIWNLPNRLGLLASLGAPVTHLSVSPKLWSSFVDGHSGLLPDPDCRE